MMVCLNEAHYITSCGVFQDYEFLDLSDVKEADLNSLQCALFTRNVDGSDQGNWAAPAIGESTKDQPILLH